jgi:spore coat protein A, manganese oxidase
VRITRRGFLKLGMMAGAGIVLPVGAMGAAGARLGAANSVTSPKVQPFVVPLPVPPVLDPVRTDATTDYYEITQRVAKQEILPGMQTEV